MATTTALGIATTISTKKSGFVIATSKASKIIGNTRPWTVDMMALPWLTLFRDMLFLFSRWHRQTETICRLALTSFIIRITVQRMRMEICTITLSPPQKKHLPARVGVQITKWKFALVKVPVKRIPIRTSTRMPMEQTIIFIIKTGKQPIPLSMKMVWGIRLQKAAETQLIPLLTNKAAKWHSIATDYCRRS